MAPLSFAAAEIVTFTGEVPSVSRTTALVVQPLGAVLACTCRRVTVTALSGVQVEPVQVEVSAPGRNTFCSPRGLALSVSPPKAIPCVKCCALAQSCSTSRCARGCRFPPDQFFDVETVPYKNSPGWPEVYVVSVAVRVETPFLKQVSTPPGAASSRRMSPAAPVVAALVSVVFVVPEIFWMKMFAVFSMQL